MSNQHFTELRIANVDKRYALRAARLEDQGDIRGKDEENILRRTQDDARGTCLLESYVACHLIGHRSTVEHQTSEIIHHQH